MKRRYLLLFCIFFTLFSLSGVIITQFSTQTIPLPLLPDSDSAPKKLILLPLDSRSQTMNFPVDLGKLANINVLLPPIGLMDNNKEAAKKDDLLAWLEANASQADAIILSTDLLLHGGLIASRRINGDQLTAPYSDEWEKKIDSLLVKLWQIKKNNPNLKIYSFSIIPRQLVSGEPPASYYQPHLYYYSQYKDKVAQFENPKDIQKLSEWSSVLPNEIISQYKLLFERNFTLNQRLIDQTEKGLFDLLIIGQDDAQPFGVPNWYREKNELYAKEKQLWNRKVFFTGGTDEIAQLLVARYKIDDSQTHFKIFTYFTESETSHRIFPYMRETLEVNASEKLKILGVEKSNTPDQSDLILVIHGGFPKSNSSQIKQSVLQINQWLHQNKKIAITDLSRNFQKDQTLLPHLLKANTPLLQLTSYAGWNTASNSLGTALSQGILFSQGKDFEPITEVLPVRHKEQAKFLIARLLDDWAFQKSIQYYENTWMKFTDYNPYQLDGESQKIARRTSDEIRNEFSQLYRSSLALTPYRVGSQKFYLEDVEFTLSFPWQRTFEINLTVRPLWRKE